MNQSNKKQTPVRNPMQDPTIVCFGDSTTAPRIVNGKELFVYADALQRYFKNKQTDVEVVNAGLGGCTTRLALERLEGEVLSRRPALVAVQFGINDSWVYQELEGDSKIPMDEFIRNTKAIIQGIKNAGGQVVLMTPNPVGKAYDAWRYRRLESYAQAVRDTAEETFVGFVDVWTLFHRHRLSIDDLLLDAMHPNDEGQQVVANGLIAWLEKNADLFPW